MAYSRVNPFPHRYYRDSGHWRRYIETPHELYPLDNSYAVPYLLIADGGALPKSIGKVGEDEGRVREGHADHVGKFLRAMAHRKLEEYREPHHRTVAVHNANSLLSDYSPEAEEEADGLCWAFLHDAIERGITQTVANIKVAPVIQNRHHERFHWANDMWEPLYPFDFSVTDPFLPLHGIGCGRSAKLNFRSRSKDSSGSNSWGRETLLNQGHSIFDSTKDHWIEIQGKCTFVNLSGGVLTISTINDNLDAGEVLATLDPYETHTIEELRTNRVKHAFVSWENYSTDATLSDITLTNGTLKPEFSSDVEAYTVDLADGEDLEASFTLSNSNATKVEYLLFNDTGYFVHVTAQDGKTKKVYTVFKNSK